MHLTETCEPDTPHVITQVADTEMTEPAQRALADRALLPEVHVVDAGYTNAAVPGGSGLLSRRLHLRPVGRERRMSRQTPKFRVVGTETPQRDPGDQGFFSPEHCRLRPKQSRTKPPPAAGRRGRDITFLPRERHEASEASRRAQNTDEWKDRNAIRAGIEGTISQAVRVAKIRHTRYRDLPTTGLGHAFAATTLNIVRSDPWPTGTRPAHLEPLIPASRQPESRLYQQSPESRDSLQRKGWEAWPRSEPTPPNSSRISQR
ncbi:transposase [Streptomyces sp. NPDC057717]|uniref:transposase n=1 Tax=Streptomyces sp. NPDC057717 TaxID=3346224 RepID=UPI00369F1410